MKKFSIFLTLVFLQILACKENGVNVQVENQSDQNTAGLFDLALGDTLIIGYFSNGQPSINIPDTIFENSFQLYCDTNGHSNANFVSSEILDYSPYDTNYIANLFLRGTYTDSLGNNISITLALELNKDILAEEYIFVGGGTTHTCTGVYCSQCGPTTNIFGKIIGCECSQSVEGYEGYCTHTVETTQGGNGMGWASLLLGLLALFF